MSTPQTEVKSKGNNRWAVRVRRELGGESATGHVTVKQGKEPVPDDVPHLALAGSRAWLRLGEKLLDADDTAGAITSARKGLDELGEDYISSDSDIDDDTDMHILVADDQIEQGQPKDGAKTLLSTLSERIGLYTELHEATLEE